jgi:hypothetical protein
MYTYGFHSKCIIRLFESIFEYNENNYGPPKRSNPRKTKQKTDIDS